MAAADFRFEERVDRLEWRPQDVRHGQFDDRQPASRLGGKAAPESLGGQQPLVVAAPVHHVETPITKVPGPAPKRGDAVNFGP